MVNDFSLEEMMPTLIDTLKGGGDVTFTVTGNSMLPMLRGREDTVTLSSVTGGLKKYDIPFYRRSDGKYVLHRIVKIKGGEYIIRGDNCAYTEYGITDDDIVGVVTAFTRKGKKHSAKKITYRIYAVLWSNGFSYFVRKKVLLGTRVRLAKIYRKICKKK